MFKNLRRGFWIVLGMAVAYAAYYYLWPYLDPRRPRLVVHTTPLRSLEGVLGAGRRTDGAGMYWLDDHRLLAVADVLPDGARADHYVEPVEKALYIWDAQSGRYRLYRALPPHDFSELCQYRGTVWYRNGVSGTLTFASYWAGMLGAETEIRMPLHNARADYLSGGHFLNTQSCNIQDEQKSLRPQHRSPGSQAEVLWLRQQDGYIFLSDPLDPLHRDDSGNAVYYRADGAAPITLPIPVAQLANAGVDYSEFAGEYVVTPDNGGGWAPQVYFLKPDGGVRQDNIPARLKLSGDAVFPTRAGLFLPRGPVPKPGADGGAWLYHDGRLYPVERHAVGSVAVSPDGCRIAMDVRDDPKLAAGTIRVADLCPG